MTRSAYQPIFTLDYIVNERENKIFGVWKQLSTIDREILAYMTSNKEVSRSELTHYLKKSDATVSNHIKLLINIGLVQPNGSVHDPGRTYSIMFKEE